jgi:hypothetical protein
MISHKLLDYLTNLTKYIPVISAIVSIPLTVFGYFNLHIHYLSFISNISLLYLILLYILSYLLHFCWKHRLCIHFLSIYYILSLIDSYFKLPISDASYTLLILLIACMFIIYYFMRMFYGKAIDHFINKLATKNQDSSI